MCCRYQPEFVAVVRLLSTSGACDARQTAPTHHPPPRSLALLLQLTSSLVRRLDARAPVVATPRVSESVRASTTIARGTRAVPMTYVPRPYRTRDVAPSVVRRCARLRAPTSCAASRTVRDATRVCTRSHRGMALALKP